MLKLLKLSVFGFLSLFSWLALAAPLQLTQDGKSEYTIQMPQTPSPMEKLALTELKHYLKISTGVDFQQGNKHKSILLQRDPTLAPQEAALQIKDEKLLLSGGDEWGILYAVYAFLENQLGIRWFSAYGDELVPKYENLSLNFNPYRQKPAFEKRALIGSSYYKHSVSSMFFLRNRLNVCNSLENKEYPGSKTLLKLRGHQSHTLFFYIPPAKGEYWQALKFKEEKYYFAEHPEFFAMNKEGKRVKNLQLCFGNPDLRKEFTRRFLECVELMGEDGVYSICAMDWPGTFCHCPECQKLEAKYQCSAGPMLDYMIELSAVIAERYPDLYLSTLAYRKNQSEKPPQMSGARLPKNIIIVFAPIDNDFSKTLAHPNNAETYQHLQEWGKLTDNLWVWYYPLAYGDGGQPFGGVSRSAIDTKLLWQAGATGTYYEHDVGVFSGMNFGDLMTWMFLKLFQNPKADVDKLVQEFCSFYYGAGAPEMVQYIGELDAATMAAKNFLLWNGGTPKSVFSKDNLLRWTRAFDQMEKKTSNDAASLSRIRETRMGLDIAVLQNDFRNLVKSAPDLFPSAEAIGQRVRLTLEQSLQKRVPEGPHQYLRHGNWKKGIENTLENAVIMASLTPKPLGAPLDQLNPATIRQVFAKQINKCAFIKVPDAAFGQAIYDKDAEVELPFSCGFYDSVGKRFLLKREIKPEEIVPDCFHLYKIGAAPISSFCYLWTMKSWKGQIRLGSLYTAGEAPDKNYEIWLSLKFEGKGYHPDSKATQNRVYLDRAVVVEK
ncbi:MAG: DUF4838 domain-containing protein [Lentisphaeria bacterium]